MSRIPGISGAKPPSFPSKLKHPPSFEEALSWCREQRAKGVSDSLTTEELFGRLEAFISGMDVSPARMETLRAIGFMALAVEYLMRNVSPDPQHIATTHVQISDMFKGLNKFWIERALAASAAPSATTKGTPTP